MSIPAAPTKEETRELYKPNIIAFELVYTASVSVDSKREETFSLEAEERMTLIAIFFQGWGGAEGAITLTVQEPGAEAPLFRVAIHKHVADYWTDSKVVFLPPEVRPQLKPDDKIEVHLHLYNSSAAVADFMGRVNVLFKKG